MALKSDSRLGKTELVILWANILNQLDKLDSEKVEFEAAIELRQALIENARLRPDGTAGMIPTDLAGMIPLDGNERALLHIHQVRDGWNSIERQEPNEIWSVEIVFTKSDAKIISASGTSLEE